MAKNLLYFGSDLLFELVWLKSLEMKNGRKQNGACRMHTVKGMYFGVNSSRKTYPKTLGKQETCHKMICANMAKINYKQNQ